MEKQKGMKKTSEKQKKKIILLWWDSIERINVNSSDIGIADIHSFESVYFKFNPIYFQSKANRNSIYRGMNTSATDKRTEKTVTICTT